MKQKNGFVFIETIIVIAVLTTALVLLYSMFTSVLNQEKRRTTYEDVAYLYRTYYLSKFYNDVAKRSITYGIDEKNPMVSIPLVSDAAKDFIPEEEQGFYENLMNSSFGITNVYLAGKDIGKLEKCDPNTTSCDVLEDLAGSNWKSYLKTLYKNDTYQLITVFGIGESKNGSACFDVFNGNTSVDSTCKFYYSSVPLVKENEPEPPVLNNGLIPVTYDTATSKWVKADTSKRWYNYKKQWWANAVTVTSSTRSKYNSASSGTEILMSDIETMWAWIPRYEYQHTNLRNQYAGGSQETPGGITINFISKDTVSASDPDNFTIHDAFKWGDDKKEQLAGIWVAKFEMSTKDSSKVESNTLESPIIKPNVPSWRSAQIATFWTAIHNNMNGSSNQYGLTNTDAHLMKNMEWGAVAYLSQSKYGKYGNADYTGADKEIYQNKSSSYITGMSNGTPSSSTTNTQTAYNIEGSGTGASTTGNIYGIYDMSGGAFEYVMGVMKANGSNEPAVGYSTSSNSGWSGKFIDQTEYVSTLGYGYLRDIESKYYDLYSYSSSNATSSYRAHKGDATYETSSWYLDDSYLFDAAVPFLYRGGARFQSRFKTIGIFSYDGRFGSRYSNGGARPALVPLNS